MRLRESLFGTILMTLVLTTYQGNAAPVFMPEIDPEFPEGRQSAGATSIAMPLAPSTIISKDKVLESAYYDTLTILTSNNTCSEFFGGQQTAVDVFVSFMKAVQKTHIEPSVAMKMYGRTSNVVNLETKAQYRLFEKISINANGPFYRRAVTRADLTVPNIGSFAPNSQKVRMLILLHELGHVMKGQDGNWLLADDGNNESLSRDNSRKIKDVCGEQINNLGKDEGMKNLARQKLAEEKVAMDLRSVKQP